MVFIRMNISRRRYFLTRLYKNYIYLLLPHGEFFLWLTLIIFWRIPFSFQQKSLICYLLSKPVSRWNKILCWIVRRLWWRKKNGYKFDFFTIVFLQFSIKFYFSGWLFFDNKLVISVGKRRGFARRLWELIREKFSIR